MYLKDNGIFDPDSWFRIAPPKGGKKQWRSGRSAQELARYMTADLPHLPREAEAALSPFVSSDTAFDWKAEYVTELSAYGLGMGEGRNHDAFLYSSDIVVGIEGKADEPFGSQLIGEALVGASENKKKRINGMTQMLFEDTPEHHANIRYQLVTASTATLLEAFTRKVKKACLLVIVFKRAGCYSDAKIAANEADVQKFLAEISAKRVEDYYVLPTPYGRENGIELYFKYLTIELASDE